MEKIKRALIRLGRWQYLPLLVLVMISVFLHLAVITHPNEPLFDEQHYVPDAQRIIAGEGTQRPEHPPLAKLLIAAGIKVFGDNPWGWRMPSVILSTIGLILFYNICRRLSLSLKAAFIATFLLSLENLNFIHGGMAMLDIYAAFFTILAFWFYLKGQRWWWLAAVSVALAGLAKLSGILAIIPIGLHWLIIGYKTINPAAPLDLQATSLRRFVYRYGPPISFILSMALAPLAFVLLYWVLDWVIWGRWLSLIVWGHWDQGVIGDIRNALSLTASIKFTGYTAPLPSRPWEWLLSPTGSFTLFSSSPQVLPYWYTPAYTGMLSPTVWLSGLAAIPYAIWRSIRQRESAAIFILSWFIGTWLVWIPLSLISDRVSFIFYYLPTIGAACLGSGLILSRLLDTAQARQKGKLKRFLEISIAIYLLLHLVAFCILSPVKLWVSIPASVLLMLFTLDYMGYNWKFILQFGAATAIWTLVLRYGIWNALGNAMGTDMTPTGLPGNALLWVVALPIGVLGVVVTFLLLSRLAGKGQPNPQPPLMQGPASE